MGVNVYGKITVNYSTNIFGIYYSSTGATPSPTNTPIPTPLLTPTPTVTNTPTPSPSPSPTPSPTPTVTNTPTPSPSPSPTPSPTPSPSPSPTPSPTPAPTPAPNEPSLQIWYDGSDSTQFIPTSPTSGTSITQWTDKSATAHNANPVGNIPTRPKYFTNVQNGLSAVFFDQLDDGFEIPSLTSLRSLTGATIIIVTKTLSTTANQQILQGVVKSGGNYTNVTGYSLSVSASTSFNVAIAGGFAKSDATLNTNFNIHTLVFDGTQSTNATRLIHRVNGVQRTLTFITNVNATTSATVNALLVGTSDVNANDGIANDFTGYVGELLIYTRKLSSTEISNTESYLSTKWNITI